MAGGTIAITKLLSLGLVAGWRPTPFLERCLGFTPGTMLSALIIPDLLSSGVIGILAAILVALVALTTKNMLLSVISGATASVILRAVLL